MAESSTSTSTTATESSDVEWRQLSRYLWVGRRDGHPVGMIEHGSHFVATGDDDVVIGRFSDLAAAQAAFSSCPAAAEEAEPGRRRRAWPFVAGGGVLVVAAGATAGAMLIH